MKKAFSILTYILMIVLSILFIFYGNNYAKKKNSNIGSFSKEVELDYGVIGLVVETNDIKAEDNLQILKFKAKILTGKNRGITVNSIQSVEKESTIMPVAVDKYDLVILYPIENDNKTEWVFENYCRIDKICILALVFIILVIVLCGTKGFNTVISLLITLLTLFYVLIPLIISGYNIYFSTICVCVFIVFMSLFITHGVNLKSLTAAIGCSFGVTFSGILEVIMEHTMKLTGYINEESSTLMNMFLKQPINLRGIIFAMVIIGCLGATMDVAMSISSALYEIKANSNSLTKKSIFYSGINIGKDTIGTMANTLILAYVGASLMTVIIYTISDYPLIILINKEELIVDFLQSLSGIMGILITIPVTTLFCSVVHKTKS